MESTAQSALASESFHSIFGADSVAVLLVRARRRQSTRTIEQTKTRTRAEGRTLNELRCASGIEII